jgi:uncharacterized protein
MAICSPRVTALALAATLAACGTTPPTRFHSLRSSQPTAAVAQTPMWVEIAPVSVPAAVDQPQWLVRVADDSLRVLEQERWVAPLRDELRAALAEHLGQRYGAINGAMAAPNAPSGAQTNPRWTLRLEVRRFEMVAGQSVWLEGAWSVTSEAPGGSGLHCVSSLREAAPGELPRSRPRSGVPCKPWLTTWAGRCGP